MFSAATKTGSQPATSAANYIDDVFSTYLYTGTGAAQSITNNIDLSTKGGLVWIKGRLNATNHNLFDTVQGATKALHTNTTASTATSSVSLTSFNSNGFSLGTGNQSAFQVNTANATYASWTFAEQDKFFDVVAYTGNGSAQTISHNLGSTPGMIIVKSTDGAYDWAVYHRSLGATQYLNINSTAAAGTDSNYWNDTAPTSTTFTVGASGSTGADSTNYIAYLFAHDAGGFGSSGTDNVVSCGSYTGNGSATGPTINLGYEPQYVFIKRTTGTGNWIQCDVMRQMSVTDTYTFLLNTLGSEADNATPLIVPTATGFQITTTSTALNANTVPYIYMAIRRPMKVPTDATTVFKPVVANPAYPYNTVTTGFVSDLLIVTQNDKSAIGNNYVADRLRGTSLTGFQRLVTNQTGAEGTGSLGFGFDSNTTIQDGYMNAQWGDSNATTYWNFSRRPGFFDEVCYSGNSTAGATQAHNLGVAPELMIVKTRSGSGENWNVYSATLGNTKYLVLNDTAGAATATNRWNNTSPTDSVFTLGTSSGVNFSTYTYVAYLFATVAGVSKVGSYSGTGSTQTISCGFTGGARFVLIKRTDTDGDWYVFDTANGLTSSSSPYLFWNATTAQTTGNNGCYGSAGGFTLTSNASSTVNISSASYIFLAIA